MWLGNAPGDVDFVSPNYQFSIIVRTTRTSRNRIRSLLSGGDRRSIARSSDVRDLVEGNQALVADLAMLTRDADWLVTQRALDLLEKLAHDHVDWVEPHKKIFIGSLADSDKWEIRLQIVRALPLFRWTPVQSKRVEAILIENTRFPQTFVRAWALDSLATFAVRRSRLAPIVEETLAEFEMSESKALQSRARNIRARIKPSPVRRSGSARSGRTR
jgi:hypothetical protein